jgi:UDP:flavonoid glycosyltransferase YjiC (YdhE family)
MYSIAMKFIIVALGSKGDNHPLLAMARLIKAYGHDIILVSTGNYNFPQLAAQYEIPFYKILDDKICDDLLKHEVEGNKKVFYKLFKEFYIDYAAPNIIDAITKLNNPGETIAR